MGEKYLELFQRYAGPGHIRQGRRLDFRVIDRQALIGAEAVDGLCQFLRPTACDVEVYTACHSAIAHQADTEAAAAPGHSDERLPHWAEEEALGAEE